MKKWRISREEKELIEQLRKEAGETKDCFTNFSFQAIILSGVVLSILAGYQKENPIVGLASTFVIIIILTVSRIGIYKYGAANRYYGYELHLYRTRHLRDSKGNGWRHEMRAIGWEEAMRAWRVVQATCFDAVHEEEVLPPLLNRGAWKKAFENSVSLLSALQSRIFATKEKDEFWGEITLTPYASNMHYKWFQNETLISKRTIIHTGTYLRTMLGILNLVSALALIPLYIMSIQCMYRYWIGLSKWYLLFAVFSIMYSFFMTGIVYSRAIRSVSRREIMETGFLSIHSCAVMWQAVVVAHYRALERLAPNATDWQQDGISSYSHYTEQLSYQAENLRANLNAIHHWVR